MDFRMTVGGDADGGFLVDIHDGTTNKVYRPADTPTIAYASFEALCEHFPEIKDGLAQRDQHQRAELQKAQAAAQAALQEAYEAHAKTEAARAEVAEMKSREGQASTDKPEEKQPEPEPQTEHDQT